MQKTYLFSDPLFSFYKNCPFSNGHYLPEAITPAQNFRGLRNDSDASDFDEK